MATFLNLMTISSSKNIRLCRMYQINFNNAKHLKRRLIEYFGEHISIAEIDGKANKCIVRLRAKAATIMHDSYNDIESNEDDDGIGMARLLGSVIRNELSQLEQPLDIYFNPRETLMLISWQVKHTKSCSS